MKILAIHTFYVHKGGEDIVFQEEQALLSESEQIEVLTFQNQAGWKGVIQFLLSVWNLVAATRLKKVLREYRPDVVHIHNMHFAIGAIAIRAAKNLGIPVVVTIHNYRLLCPSTNLLFNGKLFTDSVNTTFPWKAIRLKVYRNSYLQTIWIAFVSWFHRRIHTWLKVDAYIVLTAFAKKLFVNSTLGVPSHKFIIKPNFVKQQPSTTEKRGRHFLFIGRLSEEKGIEFLIEAFQETTFELFIIGDGPLKHKVLDVSSRYETIKYLGSMDRAAIFNELQKCSALVVPSICFEGMPVTIIEAFSSSTPVIASNIGAMSSMIQAGVNGLHFDTGSVTSFRSQLSAWSNLDEIEKNNYGKNALNTYLELYTPEKNREQLLNIYKSVVVKKES